MEGMVANCTNIIGEQIQDNLDIAHADEDAYLNELIAYQLQVEGYTYEWFIGKLVEVLAIIF